MAETFSYGWLQDYNNQKFLPRTLDTLICNKDSVWLQGLDKTILPDITDSSEAFNSTFKITNMSNLDNKILLSTKKDDTYYFFTSSGLTTLTPGGSTVTTAYKAADGNVKPFGNYSRITFYQGGDYFFAGTSYGWSVDSGSFDDNWYRMTLYYSADGITWNKGWQSADWGGANWSGQQHQPVFYYRSNQIKMFSIYSSRKIVSGILGSHYSGTEPYLSIVTGTLSNGTWSWSETHNTVQINTSPGTILVGGGMINNGAIVLFYRQYRGTGPENCGYLYSFNNGSSWTNKNSSITFASTSDYIAQQFRDSNGYGFITTTGYIFHTKNISSGNYQISSSWSTVANPPVATAYPTLHINHPIFVKDDYVYINYYTYYRKFHIQYPFDNNTVPGLATESHWDSLDSNLFYFDDSSYHAYFCPVDNKFLITNGNKSYIFNPSNFNLENYAFTEAQGRIKDTQSNTVTSQVSQILQQYKILSGDTSENNGYIPLPEGAVPRFVSISKDGLSTGLLSCDSSHKYVLDGTTYSIYWRNNSELCIGVSYSNVRSYTVLYETPLDYHMINTPNSIIHLGYDDLNAPFSNYTKWIDLLEQEYATTSHIYQDCLSNKSCLITDAKGNSINIYQKIVETPGYFNLTVKTNWEKYLAESYYDERIYLYLNANQKVVTDKSVKETPALTLADMPFTITDDEWYRDLDQNTGHFSFTRRPATVTDTTTWADLIGYGIIFEDNPSMVYTIENQTSSTDSSTGETTYKLQLLPAYMSFINYRPVGDSLQKYSNQVYNTFPTISGEIIQGTRGTDLVTREHGSTYYYKIV